MTCCVYYISSRNSNFIIFCAVLFSLQHFTMRFCDFSHEIQLIFMLNMHWWKNVFTNRQLPTPQSLPARFIFNNNIPPSRIAFTAVSASNSKILRNANKRQTMDLFDGGIYMNLRQKKILFRCKRPRRGILFGISVFPLCVSLVLVPANSISAIGLAKHDAWHSMSHVAVK